jgi:hypothetical protein
MQVPPFGAIVGVRDARTRPADQTILVQSENGVYDPKRHLAVVRVDRGSTEEAEEFVAAHVRRLEALRRADVVERRADGTWQVPKNLPELGRAYDAKRIAGAEVQLLSHFPIERQARAIGATWLDHRLIDDPVTISEHGFGADVRAAMRTRLAFLVEEGFADRRAGRVVLQGNLLASLRERELTKVGRALAAETGLSYEPVTDGQRIKGIYRRSVMLASGRFAMLDDGAGFALVPWRPVLEKKLGQTITGVLHGSSVSWNFGKSRGRGGPGI